MTTAFCRLVKFLITLLFFSIFQYSYAQSILIKGTASYQTKSFMSVHVVLNDTINKFIAKNFDPENFKLAIHDQYMRLIKDSTLNVRTDSSGLFAIRAHLTDTLYFSAYRSITQKFLVADLIKLPKIDIKLIAEPCIEFIPCKDSVATDYYVFVGEKISVKYSFGPNYCNIITWDSRYEAQYKVLKNVKGKYVSDTIRFTAYDHYGQPGFSKSKYALLFVGKYCGKLIHLKYQFFDVYPTKNGRWATLGNPYRFDSFSKSKNIKPEHVIFQDDLSFNVNSIFFKTYYKEVTPYFTVENGIATPILGTYIEDLLKIKQEGTLANRRIEIK
jgi:hypothetical protein